MQPSISRETIVDRRQPVIRWGAVFAGALVSVGLWALLQTLGMGVGLAAIDVNDAGSLRGVGIGTTIWSLIAPLIAMFLGGVIAGRFATTFDRKIGALHGLVVWALSAVVGVLATVSLVTAIAGGAVSVTKAAAGPVASAAEHVAGNINVSSDDLLGPVNQKLQQEGKPAVTADQLKNATKDVIGQAASGQKIDREALVTSLTQNTQLSRQDAEDIANRIEQKYRGVSEDVNRAGEQAKHVALQAADATGKALLFGGISLLLALVTALLGGMVGVKRRFDEDEYGRTVRTTMPPPPTAPAVITEP